jgi:hypothetical protein
MKKIFASVAALSGMAFAGSASAAIDTAGVTTALTDAGTAAGTVGAAVLVVVVGIKAFKYIKSAM